MEGVAVFDSCSAYQSLSMKATNLPPEVLFLSHCVPNPPEKGEKIRAFHMLRYLMDSYRVHLVCFGRAKSDIEAAQELATHCASVHVELISSRWALARAVAHFVSGDCLNAAFYRSREMRAHVKKLLQDCDIKATVAYTSVMLPYAPPAVPILLDMVDVDSEKWLQYARMRPFGFLYQMEARRLRQFEIRCVRAAANTFLTTRSEEDVLRSFAPRVAAECLENGVDSEFFDGLPRPLPNDQDGNQFLVFVGTMDYYPNSAAASWFATEVFPELRQRNANLEFWIVGRNPGRDVQALARVEGVRVIGAVSDIRPYLSAARAVVAPLQLARGVQNKVLEALSMGRMVFASSPVCRTFGDPLPLGVVRCDTKEDYISELCGDLAARPPCNPAIREESRRRFDWAKNLDVLGRALKTIIECDRGQRAIGTIATG